MRFIPTLALTALSALAYAVPSAAADWINVKTFGAVGNAVTDDTAAINLALASSSANGSVLYFPPGRYKMTSRLTLPDAPITVRGDGSGISTIEWANANGGILYTPTILSDPGGGGVDRELTITGLTLRTTQEGGGSAIEAIWPENEGQVAETVNIRDVQVRGQNFNKYWNTGIKLVGARNSRIENTNIYGSGATPTGLDKGIYIHSDDSSTDYRISDVEVSGVNYGIYIDGGSLKHSSGPEGVLIHQVTITAAEHGIHVATTFPEPMVNIRGSHIAARYSGIATSALSSVISDKNISIGAQDGPAGVGIYVVGTSDVAIHNNAFFGSNRYNANGIVLAGDTRKTSVTGNLMTSLTTCIWLQAPTHDNFVAQNVFTDCVANKVYDQGTGNTVFGWGTGSP